jgi:uncharacterized membrane protein YoaK (UPF0700 family)
MRRYQHRHRFLAIGMAVLAGLVDALAFLTLGGLFVSFMSGNSTRMAVGVAGPGHGSLLAGALIAAFVVGVVAGSSLGAAAGRWRKQAVLALVTLTLLLACTAATALPHPIVPTLLMAAAMGAANTTFQREGEVSIGVTYMTGTLVKFGQHLAAALAGGPAFSCLPYLLLWLGLVTGAGVGATLFPVLGLQALWVGASLALVLLGWSFALGPLPEEE